MNQHIVVIILGLGGCGTTTEPPHEISGNPPEPVTTPAALPTWDDAVAAQRVAGLNPPSPALLVTASGSRCYLVWEDPMTPEPHGDRIVTAMDLDAPGQVQCPPKAKELLDARPLRERIGMNPPASPR
jgi:hypothetical protein